jgi:hypothetical protein
MSERPARGGDRASGTNRSANHTALAGQVSEYLALHGAWVYRVHGHLGGRRGVPDVLACFPALMLDGPHAGALMGYLVAVEVKTGRGALTRDQVRERDALRQAGAVWVEVRTLDDLEDALLAAGLATERHLWPRRGAGEVPPGDPDWTPEQTPSTPEQWAAWGSVEDEPCNG